MARTMLAACFDFLLSCAITDTLDVSTNRKILSSDNVGQRWTGRAPVEELRDTGGHKTPTGTVWKISNILNWKSGNW